MADRTAIYDVMTIQEAAEDRGIHVETVRSAVRTGRLQSIRQSGATWLLLRQEVEAQWPDGPHRGKVVSGK